jgi:hypothetical protein
VCRNAMIIDSKLTALRVKARQNSKVIIDHLIKSHIARGVKKLHVEKEICIFCSSSKLLTREHVIPRWTFENCTSKYFITLANGIHQTYNKTTVPTCSICNNELLGYLENYILQLFKKTDLSISFFTNYEIQNIIRWLEIIEYKFQVLEVKRKFIKSKSSIFLPDLTDFPLTILRESINYSPSKAVAEVRLCQKRLAMKSKNKNINSLVIFRTRNKGFHFFHTLNDFIFIELPQFKIGLFYFYSKLFKNKNKTFKEANDVIDKVY